MLFQSTKVKYSKSVKRVIISRKIRRKISSVKNSPFENRHIGPSQNDLIKMLKFIDPEFESPSQLIEKVVPENIRVNEMLEMPQGIDEHEMLKEIKEIAELNNTKVKSLIGMGYYNTIVPPTILRNFFENAAWYTPYTPYQAEISQGRLESLINFQTVVADMTGLPVANASLLDEATACAEAMMVAFNATKKGKLNFFVSDLCHPQCVSVMKTRGAPYGINIIVGDHTDFDYEENNVFGAIFQYPATNGSILDYTEEVEILKKLGAVAICATDLLALTLIKSPGEIGFDIAVGTSQRLGVPIGYGGPHAAFFSCSDAYTRLIPGRIIGVSVDRDGNQAYRMALQTREQHIRREKATSNICTAQALLANMAAMYCVYHGPAGLKDIALQIHLKATKTLRSLADMGYKVNENAIFDTITVTDIVADKLVDHLLQHGFNIRKLNDNSVSFSLDQTTTDEETDNIISAFSSFSNMDVPTVKFIGKLIPSEMKRTSPYLTHPVFNTHQSETSFLRYMYKLQSKDLGLQNAMIPLGSCTMKLNAAAEMIPVSWPEFNSIHPFAPLNQTGGYQMLFKQLESWLEKITGFDAVSLQPNSGAQGEFSGLLSIKRYLESIGQKQRDICLIPVSAHGTNPASAIMAGLKVVTVKCDEDGNINMNDMREKVKKHSTNLACTMVTYPSTHGVFETSIQELCELIHLNGGQVYMDGANMNAQVGLTHPGKIGADVCHLNLHKTFCIPHGGGGPGMGPIGVKKHLAPHLPGHGFLDSNFKDYARSEVGAVSATPFSSASILPISWAYIRMMGPLGLKNATESAIINANYMAKKLEGHYDVLYKGKYGYVAHEFIIDIRPFKQFGIEADDISKRLMDYGFHAPTTSFPVMNTLMIEPTESEPLEEMDRLIEALIDIRNDIRDVEEGKVKAVESPIKNAPHTVYTLSGSNWEKSYTREKAGFPLPWVKSHKFWPSVSRIDNSFGDRNLICSCPPMSDY